MKKTILCTLALGLSFTTAHADIFGSGADAFTIDFVTIGNPGNVDDRALDSLNDTPEDPTDDEYATPFGGVPYLFRIGVTEVPQDWINKATNLGMVNVTAGAWTGLQPATYMTWYEAAAFVNWLNTSTGHQAAYQLNGTNSALTLWSSAQAWQADGENLYRHKDAYYFLPSEDEWYKAAYHKNDGATANYWDYATGSNSIPESVGSGTQDGTAVFDLVPGVPAAVSDAGGLSPYGTRGQNGNAWEWMEGAYDRTNNFVGEERTIRGGWANNPESTLRSSRRDGVSATLATNAFGLRVASIPEPSCAMLMLSGSLLAFARSRRRTAL